MPVYPGALTIMKYLLTALLPGVTPEHYLPLFLLRLPVRDRGLRQGSDT